MRERRICQRDDARTSHKLLQKSASRSVGNKNMPQENNARHLQVSVWFPHDLLLKSKYLGELRGLIYMWFFLQRQPQMQ